MLGSTPITSATPTLQTSNSTAQPSSPRLSNRLRGMSLLRSYTNGHDSSSSSEQLARSHPRTSSNRIASTATITATEEPTSPSTTGPPLRRFRSGDPGPVHRHTSASQASTGGWLPTVDGSSVLARPTTQLQPSPATTGIGEPHEHNSDMSSRARSRSATVPNNGTPQAVSHEWSTARSPRRMLWSSTEATSSPRRLVPTSLPSIQLTQAQDPRSSRPSLTFPITTRTLPTTTSLIRVGRYSERDPAGPSSLSNTVSDAPVGFKSKVVSRRHCEFSFKNNQWYVKDVGSSSGTFLNHIRLSQPGVESIPSPIKDGDVIQLGIDFKGGEEAIFRCVKIRVTCNKGWQRSVNKFNKSAHKRLNELQRSVSQDPAVSANSTECTICLNQIAPCQSLFVAPCSHTWHYKCIRPVLEMATRSYSGEIFFQCPNCRNVADLEAEIDERLDWDDSEAEEGADEVGPAGLSYEATQQVGLPSSMDLGASMAGLSVADEDLAVLLSDTSRPLAVAAAPMTPAALREAEPEVRMNGASREGHDADDQGETNPSPDRSTEPSSDEGDGASVPIRARHHRVSSSTPLSPCFPEGDTEGPLTPRNNAGPFVLDGGASSLGGNAMAPRRSLAASPTERDK